MAGHPEGLTVAVPNSVSAADAAKKQTTVVVEAINSPGNSSSDNLASEQPTWEPGFKKRFPWVGFAALCTAILCSVATILALKFANKKAASVFCNGKIAPNVFLSIFNSIANLAITLAVGQGVAIAWWRRALAGQTVKELHYSWSFSTSLAQILIKFKYFNMIALAALATKIAIVDSVLYQKAIEQYGDFVTPDGTETFTQFTSEMFPYTGQMGETIGSEGIMNSDFNMEFYHWFNLGGSISQTVYITDCTGDTCKLHLPAAGFSIECTNTTETIDYGVSAIAAYAQNVTSGYQNLPIFGVNFTQSFPSATKNYSSIIMNMQVPITDETTENVTAQYRGSCPLRMQYRTCELRPATLDYTVVYTNQLSATRTDQRRGISSSYNSYTSQQSNGNQSADADINVSTYAQLQIDCDGTDPNCAYYDQAWKQLSGIKVLAHRDVFEPFQPKANSTLTGFFSAFEKMFGTSATASYNGTDWFLREVGALASEEMDTTIVPNGFCNYSYLDPMKLIIQQVNMLSFSVAADSSYYFDYVTPPDYTDANATAGDEFYYYQDVKHPKYPVDLSLLKNQTAEAVIKYKDVFYKTNWKFVWGAMSATVVVIAFILPVYWGFWELGRKVSLGPLEIANAFGSPAFASGQHTRGHADEVVKAVGRNKFQYKEVVDDTGKRYVFHAV